MTRLIVLILPMLLLAMPARAEPGLLCRGAIQAAEREGRLPPHLLMAIGRSESGRRDPVSGRFHPWPWTINAEGRGSFFASKQEAIAAVQALWAQGVRSIDVGCMQINLRHHPDAFPNLDAAFDPLTNARYAARFLNELNATRNDWSRAASAYHSNTPEFAEPYRQRVMAAWAEEMGRPFPTVALPGVPFRIGPALPAAAAVSAMPGGGGAMLSNGAARMPLPVTNAPVTGRGLDAYRTAPVPITGRTPAQAQAPLSRGLREVSGLRDVALRPNAMIVTR